MVKPPRLRWSTTSFPSNKEEINFHPTTFKASVGVVTDGRASKKALVLVSAVTMSASLDGGLEAPSVLPLPRELRGTLEMKNKFLGARGVKISVFSPFLSGAPISRTKTQKQTGY